MKAVVAARGQRIKTGYTIIEVMIVLAISGIIFISAMTLFNGQGSETSFDQTMQDANSELSSRVKGASTSQFFNQHDYSCTVTGTPPRAVLGSGGGSKNQDCVVIGTALEAATGDNTVYAYQVLGNRLTYVNGIPGGLASSLADANPTPATSAGNDLTESYNLPNDISLVSAKAVASDGSSFDSNLVGFYIDFNGEETVGNNGSQTVTAQAYNYTAPGHDSAAVTNCIENSPCPQPTSISTWKLCFKSTTGKRRAQININSQPSGVTTELKFINCS